MIGLSNYYYGNVNETGVSTANLIIMVKRNFVQTGTQQGVKENNNGRVIERYCSYENRLDSILFYGNGRQYFRAHDQEDFEIEWLRSTFLVEMS